MLPTVSLLALVAVYVVLSPLRLWVLSRPCADLVFDLCQYILLITTLREVAPVTCVSPVLECDDAHIRGDLEIFHVVGSLNSAFFVQRIYDHRGPSDRKQTRIGHTFRTLSQH